MPYVPLVQTITERIRGLALSSTNSVNKARQDKIIALFSGIPFKYACPVPLLVPTSDPDFLSDFEPFLDEFMDTLLGDIRTINGKCDIVATDALALFEALFIFNDHVPRLIVYPGFASGDMYGVGASLVMDPKMEILILADGTKTGRIDRSKMVQTFLGEFLKKERITLGVVNPRGYATTPPFTTTKKDELDYLVSLSEVLWEFFRDKEKIFYTVDLFFGTGYVANRFSENGLTTISRRTAIRTAWETEGNCLTSSVKRNIGEFLVESGLGARGSEDELPSGKNIMVLWARFTGKTGGAHLEYDTSFKGLRQLTKLAFDSGNDYVIIVGDKPKTSVAFDQLKLQRRANKIASIRDLFDEPVIDLTEFWTSKKWADCFKFSKPKRIDQFKLFEVIHRTNRVKHFGARSGNLESLALLGYTVRYFEDEYGDGDEALDKKRMEPWHATVGYQRIQISAVPTRSGKFIIDEEDPYPKWHYGKREPLGERDFLKIGKNKRATIKPPGVANGFAKGFSKADLAKIEVYFKPTVLRLSIADLGPLEDSELDDLDL